MIQAQVEDRRALLPDGREVHLPRGEVVVLSRIVAARGRCVTHEDLCLSLWPITADEPEGARAIITLYVHRLRRKLGKDVIWTVWGSGYRLGGAWPTAGLKETT